MRLCLSICSIRLPSWLEDLNRLPCRLPLLDCYRPYCSGRLTFTLHYQQLQDCFRIQSFPRESHSDEVSNELALELSDRPRAAIRHSDVFYPCPFVPHPHDTASFCSYWASFSLHCKWLKYLPERCWPSQPSPRHCFCRSLLMKEPVPLFTCGLILAAFWRQSP